MTRKLGSVLLAVAVASPLALSGCNTVQGFGEDISATGRAVENVGTYRAPPPPGYYYQERYYVDGWGNRHYY